MNVSKKLGRMKQWAGERMGGEAKTSLSDDFKALESEMTLRHEGLTQNHKSMSAYVKAISKREEVEPKEKLTPVAWLGSTMVHHGEDFENDSEFGQCMTALGHTNGRISRFQETYVAKSTTTWLESLERSLAQMKEYQAARKKLEARRLAYDTALVKMQKAKKEDFRTEEELRAQKAKYEETSEDVYRRMQDIQEAEADSVADLGEFLDAELNYYAKCHETLLQLRKEWPAGPSQSDPSRRGNRSRSNTAHSFTERYAALEEEEEPAVPERPAIRSSRNVTRDVTPSPQKELPGYEWERVRPTNSRSTTFENSLEPPASFPRVMTRAASDSLSIRTQKAQLRSVGRAQPPDIFDDSADMSSHYNSTNGPDRYYGERVPSPASSTISNTSSGTGRKAPPPPPSRAKKPPPPPPPMKRSALNSTPFA